MIEFTLPIKLESTANQRLHWRVKAKSAKLQRLTAYEFAYHQHDVQKRVQFPVVVHIVRLGKRKLDSDNLAISAKAVRDGIADALGVDDGDEMRVTWTYAQEIAKEYGCRVRITQGSNGMVRMSV